VLSGKEKKRKEKRARNICELVMLLNKKIGKQKERRVIALKIHRF